MSQKPTQHALWRETIYKALDDSICAMAPSNKNPYEWMGKRLWPSRTDRTAYARIKACLDPEQESTNFTPAELITILADEDKSGVEIAVTYLMDVLNRTLGEKRAPKSPKTVLLEQQAFYAAEQLRLQKEIDRCDVADELKKITALK